MLTSARYLSLLKQFTYKHPKGLVTHFQKMVLFTILWRTVSEILKVWSRQTLLNYCWVSIFFDILTANISWTVAQIPINYIIFRKSVMRTFRCIYTSCFNRLRFFAENSTKLQKMNFFGQFRTTPLLGNMEARQMASFFHLLFSALTVCNTIFCIWK